MFQKKNNYEVAIVDQMSQRLEISINIHVFLLNIMQGCAGANQHFLNL